MVSELGNEDRIALVAYAGSSSIILDSTSTENKNKIYSAIDNLKSGGSTAGGAGIRMAYDTAKHNFLKEGNNRVILATDGDFNVGVSSHQELVSLVEKERESGIFLSVLGFGTGNYQDGKMEQLSNHGNGNYHYIDSMLEAKKVLLQDLTGTLFAIAKDVKIQVEFNPARVKAFRLVGYENRKLAHKDFSNDLKDAGELGAGHTVTALYEIVPTGSKENLAETPTLKYGNKVEKDEPVATTTSDFANEVATVKLRYKLPKEDKSKLLERTVKTSDFKQFPETGNDFKFQTAVAEFGLLLRNSVAKGKSSFEAVLKRAKTSKGADEFGYRADFIKLAESAQLLSKTR
jgi:Ca-activated chloride channel family protein